MTSSVKARRSWDVLPRASASQLEAVGPYPALIAQLLYNRGVRNSAEAEAFLDPAGALDDDPTLLPGVSAAVERLTQAVRAGESIAVYGDFDADGVTSSALLTEGLSAIGARVVPYIPDRVAEGHGLNLQALHHLRECGVSLIVTADCGIGDAAEVAAAADLGMDTVITDHHSPPAHMPDAVAVVNPKLPGSPQAFADLASVGVASRLIDALYARLEHPRDTSLLEYVALGTVADLAPMSPMNRHLVRHGLRTLNETRRPGLRALLDASGIVPGQVDTEVVAFTLGPRINAPGRIDHADASYKLLVARSAEEAKPLAEELNARNTERQRMTREILEGLQKRIDPGAPILIVGDPEYAPGVIGLAAGKLREEHNRPAIVCQVGTEEIRGSCRSIPEFNIIEALRKVDDLFLRYGGHAQAAGFTMETRNFDSLRERLTAMAARELDVDALQPRIVIDAEIRMERLTGQIIRQLRQLAPHGPRNPAPSFLARFAEVRESRRMGDQGQHLRLKLRAGGVSWNAVAFDTELENRAPAPYMDLVFTFSVDRFDGGVLQMRVLDMAPSEGRKRLV